jgi:uncharacterized protein YPO0396
MDLSKIPDILKKIVADKELEIQELPKKVNEFKQIINEISVNGIYYIQLGKDR